MKPYADFSRSALLPNLPKAFPYRVVLMIMLAVLSLQVARLFWTLAVAPGPAGNWRMPDASGNADPTLLSRFDPFFRDGAVAGPAVVTSLAVKLYGVRLDQAMGRGSAIIATPDGVQSSYAVGDEIMPGVRLKAVAFDGVTIERGGVAEQVYLDQSVAAPVVQPAAPTPVAPVTAAPAPARPAADAPPSLANDIAYAPRIENGQLTGFVVSPKGSGGAFAAAGLKAGDVVKTINGQPVRSVQDAASALRAATNGVSTFAVERGGKTVTLSAKVGS